MPGLAHPLLRWVLLRSRYGERSRQKAARVRPGLKNCRASVALVTVRQKSSPAMSHAGHVMVGLAMCQGRKLVALIFFPVPANLFEIRAFHHAQPPVDRLRADSVLVENLVHALSRDADFFRRFRDCDDVSEFHHFHGSEFTQSKGASKVVPQGV